MSLPQLSEALIQGAESLLIRCSGDAGKNVEPFVFVGNSLLHMASLNAWILKRSSEGAIPIGIVCNDIPNGKRPQFGASDIIGFENGRVAYLQDHVDYEIIRNKLDRLISLVVAPVDMHRSKASHIFKKLTFIYPDHGMPSEVYWNAVLNLADTVDCIAVEEGIASYLSIESESSLFAYLNKSILDKLYELVKIKCLSRRKESIRNRIRSKLNIERFGIFSSSNLLENPSPDSDYAKWMISYFRRNMETLSPAPKIDFSNTILVLGTANADFVEQDIVDSLLESIFNVIQYSGYKVYYRAHPRQVDRYESMPASGFSVDVYPQYPIEEIIANADHKPIATIGFCSTAQLICSVFWNIPAIGASGLLFNKVVETTESAASRQFCKRLLYSESKFPDYYEVVGSIEEIREAFERI